MERPRVCTRLKNGAAGADVAHSFQTRIAISSRHPSDSAARFRASVWESTHRSDASHPGSPPTGLIKSEYPGQKRSMPPNPPEERRPVLPRFVGWENGPREMNPINSTWSAWLPHVPIRTQLPLPTLVKSPRPCRSRNPLASSSSFNPCPRPCMHPIKSSRWGNQPK